MVHALSHLSQQPWLDGILICPHCTDDNPESQLGQVISTQMMNLGFQPRSICSGTQALRVSGTAERQAAPRAHLGR